MKIRPYSNGAFPFISAIINLKFNMKVFFKKLIKKPVFIVIVAVVILIGGIFYFSRGDKSPDFVVAKKGNITQLVSVTGRIKPAESVDLAFEKGGKISRVYAKVGDRVIVGQLLASLNNADLAAQLSQAEANLESEKAKLNELKLGTRPEEMKVQEVKVENAKTALEDAKKNLIDKLKDSYTKSDDAIRNNSDQLFVNPRGTPQLSFSILDSQLKNNLESERIVIETRLNGWKSSLDNLSLANDLLFVASAAKDNLNIIKSFLDNLALAVGMLTSSPIISQTTIDNYKSVVSTARTSINTAITNLSAAEEKLRNAESDLNLAETELALKTAGTLPEQIAAQEAQVKEAEANVKNYQAQVAKTVIYSPINGIVARQDVKVGETASADTPVISLISDAQFEIEVNIPEADVAKVKISDTANITLDAYGQDVIFEAKVIKIDPAETMIEGVATYKTTLEFIKEDERLKSGMTANIDILTAKLEGVIIIPQRNVITKNGDKIVEILDSKIIKEVKVKTGLRGSDGNVEIIEGLKEGDKVLVSQGE